MDFSFINVIAFVVLSWIAVKFIVELFEEKEQVDTLVLGVQKFRALAAQLFPDTSCSPPPAQAEEGKEEPSLGSQVDVMI